MKSKSLGNAYNAVWFANSSYAPTDARTNQSALPPLDGQEKIELIRFLLIGEKVTGRMALECGQASSQDVRSALVDVASNTSCFDAMFSHYLARDGYDIKSVCGSLEMRTVALLRDKLSRIFKELNRIAFLNALQRGLRRRVQLEIPRIEDRKLIKILNSLVTDLKRRDRRTTQICRSLSVCQAL